MSLENADNSPRIVDPVPSSDIAGTLSTDSNKLQRVDDSKPLENKKSKSNSTKIVLGLVALVALIVTLFIYRKQLTTALNKLFNPKKKDDES